MNTTDSKNSALPPPQPRRGRGKRAGLNLAQIVGAARALAPAAVTMQAVADELGVDRKALNYYVADRESLLNLVAMDVFSVSFASLYIAPESTWQEACRTYGLVLADSIIETGVLTEHFRLSASLAREFLPLAEAVLGKLISAGLSTETSARALAMLCTICSGYASDAIAAASTNEHSLALRLQQACRNEHGQPLKHLESITASAVRTYNPEQLELSIDIFIRGTEALLQDTNRARVLL
jgi:TetR/AcrR family transcriptional regulator, tetracycline repressor protein